MQIQITVEREQLLSHPLLVKDIDCLSVSPRQLRSINRNFELPILRYSLFLFPLTRDRGRVVQLELMGTNLSIWN